jgi:hypothetical protein
VIVCVCDSSPSTAVVCECVCGGGGMCEWAPEAAGTCLCEYNLENHTTCVRVSSCQCVSTKVAETISTYKARWGEIAAHANAHNHTHTHVHTQTHTHTRTHTHSLLHPCSRRGWHQQLSSAQQPPAWSRLPHTHTHTHTKCCPCITPPLPSRPHT